MMLALSGNEFMDDSEVKSVPHFHPHFYFFCMCTCDSQQMSEPCGYESELNEAGSLKTLSFLKAQTY